MRLLTRNTRGVTLTVAGAAFSQRVGEILSKLDQARTEMQAQSGELMGDVALGTLGSIGATHAAPLVAEFHALYPKVLIHLREGFDVAVHEWLQSGLVEIAILQAGMQTRNLSTIHLFEEDLLVVGPPDAAHDTDAFTFAEIAALPMLLPSQPFALRRVVDRVAAEQGLTMRVDITLESIPLTIDLVKRGAGYTILPRSSVVHELNKGALSVLEVADARITRHIVCATSTVRALSPIAALLRDLIVARWASSTAQGQAG